MGKPLVLDTAKEIIYGERENDYGSASANFKRIATLWSAILGMEVTADQVVLCMIGLKMARLVNTPDHEDSWVDIAGYVGVWDKVRRGE